MKTADWSTIRTRIDAVGRALSGATDAPEHVRAVLEERARALARPAAPATPADGLEVVTFALAGERYALESRYVMEVFRLRALALLPGAAPPLFGVTAWRGALLTILDLRAVLGLPMSALNDLSGVIVLGEERRRFGVLADALQDLVTLAASEVKQPPARVATRSEYLRGMTPDALLVLDAARILRLHQT